MLYKQTLLVEMQRLTDTLLEENRYKSGSDDDDDDYYYYTKLSYAEKTKQCSMTSMPTKISYKMTLPLKSMVKTCSI